MRRELAGFPTCSQNLHDLYKDQRQEKSFSENSDDNFFGFEFYFLYLIFEVLQDRGSVQP